MAVVGLWGRRVIPVHRVLMGRPEVREVQAHREFQAHQAHRHHLWDLRAEKARKAAKAAWVSAEIPAQPVSAEIAEM